MTFFISGATSGIGLATAKLCLARNYRVILNGRRRDRLDELAKTAGDTGQVLIAPFDVTDNAATEAFVRDHQDWCKQVDVLVNNAGLAKGIDPLQTGKIQDWQTMLQTNVMGLLHLTRSIVPFMVEKKSGHVINIGSTAGRWVYPGGAVYCASKFAVRALTEGLRMDLIGSNIRVSNIEPGMVETEFSQVRLENVEKAKNVYRGLQPLVASDIAETILWVAERPPHVNIQEMVLFPTAQASATMVHRN